MGDLIDQCRGWLADTLVRAALAVAPEAEGKELAGAVAPVYLRRVGRELEAAFEDARRLVAARADAKGARFRAHPLDGG